MKWLVGVSTSQGWRRTREDSHRINWQSDTLPKKALHEPWARWYSSIRFKNKPLNIEPYNKCCVPDGNEICSEIGCKGNLMNFGECIFEILITRLHKFSRYIYLASHLSRHAHRQSRQSASAVGPNSTAQVSKLPENDTERGRKSPVVMVHVGKSWVDKFNGDENWGFDW